VKVRISRDALETLLACSPRDAEFVVAVGEHLTPGSVVAIDTVEVQERDAEGFLEGPMIVFTLKPQP
jgi:hypothetical protein